MKLHISPSSPFVRKTRIVILELGLQDRVEEVISIPWDKGSAELMKNPAGKVPVLITDDEESLCDSPVICEYLDSLSDRASLFPPIGQARWAALRLQALADALLDVMIARRVEGNRPGDADTAYWIDRHWTTVHRSVAQMAHTIPAADKPLDIRDIAMAVALVQLLYRFEDKDWRPGQPELASWFNNFIHRESFEQTQPVDHNRVN